MDQESKTSVYGGTWSNVEANLGSPGGWWGGCPDEVPREADGVGSLAVPARRG